MPTHIARKNARTYLSKIQQTCQTRRRNWAVVGRQMGRSAIYQFKRKKVKFSDVDIDTHTE